MKEIEKKVYEIVLPFADELGLEVYDVIYAKQGKDMYLSIYIDKSSGIDINDCENLSNLINEELDAKVNIQDQYFLEVTSSGLERHIRNPEHFKKYLDTNICINLFKPVNKVKQYIGILKTYTDNTVTIISDEQEFTFDKKDISLIKTVYDWDNEKGVE
ncbi:MAG: ribosome maturation factor RimP [Clostridiales bacterium]|nr:ribosome maturation factor RimP [Clostridiales bacterium]